MRGRLALALATGLGLLAAACGSTVPLAQQKQIQETGAQEPGDTFADTGLVGSVANPTVAGRRTGLTGLRTATAAPGTAMPGRAASAGVNGPGVTSTTVKIGIGYVSDAGALNAALGAAGATQIDTRRAYNALVKDINDRGGIGGRKVSIVYHEYSAGSTEPYDQQDQAACARWTQDDPVFISDGGLQSDTLLACMEKAGAISALYMDPIHGQPKRQFRRFPHYLQPANIDLDDLQHLRIDSLVKMGCFRDTPKIGLVSIDDPDFRNMVDTALVPALRKHGLKLADQVYVRPGESGSDIGPTVTAISNAAVRFNSSGVTHVLFTDAGANLAFFFMQSAENQGYRPRYCLDANSGNTGLAGLLQDTGSEEQLRGAMSIGWVPSLDVLPEDLPEWVKPPREEECYRVMRRAGVTMDSANARGQAQIVCDTMWLIEATLNRAGPVLNQRTFLQGLQRLGEGYRPAGIGFGVSLTATRRDGLRTVANMRFFEECTCFRYVSGQYPVYNTD